MMMMMTTATTVIHNDDSSSALSFGFSRIIIAVQALIFLAAGRGFYWFAKPRFEAMLQPPPKPLKRLQLVGERWHVLDSTLQPP